MFPDNERRRQLWMRLLLAILVLAVVAACAPATPAPVLEEAPAEKAAEEAPVDSKQGGTITWADYEPNTLNPYIVSEAIARSTVALVNRGLVGVSPQGEFFPVMAAEIPSRANGGVSDDGTTITWRLRPDLKWSDGSAITSDDIKFTWEAVSHPESGATQTQGFNLIESIDTPDELTAVVQYQEFWAPWVSQFALGLLPRKAGEPAEMNTWDWNRDPDPTNGPFLVEEWQAGDHMIFVRNEEWYEEGKPYLDEILYPFTVDLEVQRQMLRTGESDMHHWLAGDYVEEVTTWPNVEVKEGDGPYWYRVQFKLSERGDPRPAPPAEPHHILGDIQVRKALGLALNREEIVSHWKGVNFMQSMFRGEFACDLPPYEYDPGQAEALLEEAGWTDEDGDGIRECHGCMYADEGTPLRLELSSYTGWNREDEQVIMVDQWKDVGVDAHIQNHEPTVLYGTWGEGSPARRGDFDIMWWDYELGLDPQVKAEDFYASWRIPTEENPGGFNCTRVSDEEIDEWLQIAGSTADSETRQEAYCNIAEKIRNDIFEEWVVGTNSSFSASTSRIKGWEVNEAYVPYAIFGWDAENWYIEE